jgi:ribokinase
VLAGFAPDASVDPQKVAHALLDNGVKQIVMTMGEQGALIVTGSSITRMPAIQVTAVDTTGAGDAFNAGLATALGFGSNLEEAVQFAIVCGGLAVTGSGVIPSLPHREDVMRIYGEQNWPCPSWFSAEPHAVKTQTTS